MYERYGEVGSVLSIRSLGNKVSFQFSAGISKAVCIVALILASATSAAEDATQYELNIAPQNIEQALRKLAEITGKELLFLFDQMESLESEQISGTYTIEDALAIILENTSLSGELTQDGVILITPKQKKSAGSAMDVKKAGLIAVVVGALTGDVNAQEPAVTEQEIQASVVTGKVTDARTGTNLRGALVRIEETEQRTSTNNQGEFRFVVATTGSVTLTVSYLGYEGQSAVVRVRGDRTSHAFALRGGNEVEEILVVGQRSARALSLNQERTAENSISVLSSDLLGKFPGATLAETLRRAPGITFQENALTGEGTNIIVRGLAPDLNQIRLDGQRLAEGSGQGRSPSIGNLLTDSIDEVTISKTLLPSQDSNGSGGLIEITTKGPLDRPRRFVQFSAETEWNDDFVESDQFSGTLSGIFGSRDQFGLSASLQSRSSENQTVQYFRFLNPQFTGDGVFGQYLPLAADGSVITLPSAVSPLTSFPFESDANEVYPGAIGSTNALVDFETMAGTLSAQWQPSIHTNLRLSYTRTERETNSSRRSARFNDIAGYVVLPIDELGGELRGAYVWEDAFAAFGAPGLLGSLSQEFSGAERDETTDILSLKGETNLGPWDFDYRFSRSTGERDTLGRGWTFRAIGDGSVPGFLFYSFTPDLLDPAVFANLIDGRAVSSFAPIRPGDSGLQLPLLSQAGFDLLNDPASYSIGPSDSISLVSDFGENTRESFAFSTRRSFLQSPLQYLEAGIEYEETRFDFVVGDATLYNSADGNPISLDQLGIGEFRGDNLSAIGLNGGFLSPTAEDLAALFGRLGALSTGSGPLLAPTVFPSTTSDAGTFTDEEELALYLQSRVDVGDFEIIGGVRYSRVDVQARSLSQPTLVLADGTFNPGDFGERFRTLVDNEGSHTSLLPRIAVNWRPNDNFIVRGGYFQSVARPRVQNLSGNQSVSLNLRPQYGVNGDQPQLTVRKGNPDLEPSTTHSFDLSAALYDDNAGVLQVSLFYKNIEDFIEFASNATSDSLEGVVLPDDTRFQNLPDNTFVRVTKPTNNDEPAEIYGVEISAERQFVQLPGIWGGFGVFANYTWTDSEKFFVFNNVVDPVSNEFVDVEVSGVPFDQSPKHSGTVALTYNRYRIDATLAYSAQSERLGRYLGYGLSEYNDSDDTLDLRIEYQVDAWNGTWNLFFAGQDLLKGTEDPDTLRYVGDSAKYYTNGTFFGGRTFIVGFSGTY